MAAPALTGTPCYTGNTQGSLTQGIAQTLTQGTPTQTTQSPPPGVQPVSFQPNFCATGDTCCVPLRASKGSVSVQKCFKGCPAGWITAGGGISGHKAS